MIQAAKATAQLLLLAAVCLPAFANIPRTPLVAEKPHLGSVSFALASHRAEPAANSLIAPGLPGCLYDSGTRPCCSGKERDAETGLDYFGARYMSSAQGRFTSPDELLMDQDQVDPQSWNLYGYVRNNPLRYLDPTGEACVEGKDGRRHDDNSGGPSCADVKEADAKLRPSSTTTATPEPTTWSQYFGFDRDYQKAIGQQSDIDMRVGRWDKVPVLMGEAPSPTAVYRGLSKLGEVVYVGITSSLKNRARQHTGRFVLQEVNGLGKLSRADAKAVEQVLIEKYGLLKNGGILTNRINSIAVSNPTYASSLIRGAETASAHRVSGILSHGHEPSQIR